MIVEVLEKTFKDDFFKQYKINNEKLLLIISDEKLYQEANQYKFRNLSFSVVDTLNLNQKVFLRLEEYLETNNIIRLQISCHDSLKTNMLYSTSYKKANGKIELNKGVSPYITED
jgi:hypothetical protein